MRIFSKFHDYYDRVLGYGFDPHITYDRKEEEITEPVTKNKVVYNNLDKIWNTVFDFAVGRISCNEFRVLSKHLVLFCGKVYLCIRVEYITKYIKGVPYHTTEYVYTNEVFTKLVKTYSKIDLTEHYYDVKKRAIGDRFKSMFRKQGTQLSNIVDIHFKLDAPIIELEYNINVPRQRDFKVFKNKCLSEIEFYKAVSPYTAFQELSMFIGGVMGGKSPAMIEVSDKDRIAKHGFDKYSFRKEPTN